DGNRERIVTMLPSSANASFNFNGIITGIAQADLWLGLSFFFFQASSKEDKTLKRTVTYLYGQDDFRVSKKLTLNFGLRYELVPGFTERDGLLLTFKQCQKSQVS